MTLKNKIVKILGTPSADQRLKSQLRYAFQLSSVEDGKFDDLLQTACDRVLERIDACGVIDNALTHVFEELLMPMYETAKSYRLHMAAHAHIDMNWQWGYQETVNLTLDTFRTMLRLMEEYPDFVFSQSQVSTYQICEEYDSTLFEAIRKRVQEGRWEVTASTWTEADKNLPSGESLLRHHLYSKQYLKEKFGLTSEQLPLDFEPDTFGHSAFVPEILNSGEIKYYYHCRGKENEYAYRYQAPTGATVLCYQDPFFYNAVLNEYFIENVPTLCNRYGAKVSLRVYGVGDHGGGPSRRDIEMIQQMQQWPIAPTIVFSRFVDFFKELEQAQDKLPIIDQERNYIFTGCYSSQSEIKAGNRLCEDRLYIGETMSAMSVVFGNGEPKTKTFAKAWQRVMFNQFHDILPGSCMRDGRHYAMGLYQEALSYTSAGLTSGILSLAEAIDSSAFIFDDDKMSRSEGAGGGFGSALQDFAFHTTAEYGRGKTRIYHVFNPTAFDRKEVTNLMLWDWQGDLSRLVCQSVDGTDLTFKHSGQSHYWGHERVELSVLVSVPAYGVTTVVVKEGNVKNIGLHDGEIGNQNHRIEYFPSLVLENQKIRAEFDRDMCLISLVEKDGGQELIREKAAYFEYYAESSRIHMPNAWSEGSPVKIENINQVAKTYIADRGFSSAVDQSIDYDLEYGDTRIHVCVSLPAESSLLQFNIKTDWRENGFHGQEIPTLRFRVPLSYQADTAWYDVPLGVAERQALPHDVPARSFAYAPNGDQCGVAVLCNTQGAYRNENNTLSVTLLRATSIPDHLPEVGLHYQKVAIGVLPPDRQEIQKAALGFLHPLPYTSVCPHKGDLPCEGQFMRVDGKVVVSGIKTPENTDKKEMILRFYSLEQQEQTVNLWFYRAPVSACRVNALEKDEAALSVCGNEISLTVAPLSLNSIKITF